MYWKLAEGDDGAEVCSSAASPPPLCSRAGLNSCQDSHSCVCPSSRRGLLQGTHCIHCYVAAFTNSHCKQLIATYISNTQSGSQTIKHLLGCSMPVARA